MTYKRPRFTQRHRWFAWALAPKVWCALTLGNVLSESEPSAGIPTRYRRALTGFIAIGCAAIRRNGYA